MRGGSTESKHQNRNFTHIGLQKTGVPEYSAIASGQACNGYL
jgi:hypothetical protein